MKLSELKEFDTAAALKGDETIRHFLSFAFEGGTRANDRTRPAEHAVR